MTWRGYILITPYPQGAAALVLLRADVHKPDASGIHVGGVLRQLQADGSNRAIGYFSKKLKGAKC